ncbi:MAG TPA: PQQ-binding-like beta-propeller repeat protein [Candidatus Polarisedimenticolia bacterium]|nr:PQQ-binding-like beta-propeller repeat protein [Candidatus Polarisedimenticolia bacterium]
MPSFSRDRLLPAAVFLVLVVGAMPATARDAKSVFTGLPIDPEVGAKPAKAEKPIRFEPAWSFAGFTAPLAGDLASSEDVLAGTDVAGHLVVLGSKDGAERWRVDLEDAASVGPALAADRVLQPTSGGKLRAFALADGQPLWSVDLGGAPAGAAVFLGGVILQTTRTPELVALDPRDGTVTGRLPLESIPLPPEEARLKHGVAAVVAAEGGQVRLVAPGSLEVRWRRELGQSITSPPLVTKDRIYLAAADRSIRSLKLSSGRQTWAQRVGSRISARLVVRGEFLYALCYDTDIYLLGARNGHLRGRVHLDHRLAQDAALGEGRLFVAPYTAAALVGLEFPALAIAGRYDLNEHGEWFTTAPAFTSERVALGWGRETGHLVALNIVDAPPEKKEPPKPGADKSGTTATPSSGTPGTSAPGTNPPDTIPEPPIVPTPPPPTQSGSYR